MTRIIHEELSREIIGAAMEVLNELKPGVDEKLYERAMIIELRHRGHSVSVQSPFPVCYRGELIGNITSLDLAILMNFKNARFEWKRVLRPQEPDDRSSPDLHA
jgi:hypothetical protein